MSDVRMLVEAVPSTLGLNANWSIPERLISLQKLFYLSQPALIKAVKRQPYLVTCSVNRHIDIANFFSESLGMTSSEIRNMATYFPDVIMSNLDTLQKCYSILSDVYGFSTDDIRYICVQCPRVFTKTMLQDSDARLDIFRTELNLVPPFEDIQKLVLKVPSVLCMSADYFLLPNIQLIKEYLYLSSMDLGILISSAPLLLRYRPLTLRSKLESTFTFLTSENKSVLLNGTTYNFRYRDLSVQFVDAIFDGKSVESLFTYQPILLLEEKVVLSDDSTSEESEISSLEILMQKLVNQSDDTLLPDFAPPSLITDEETGFTNFIPDELIDLDLVESDEVSVDLGSGRSWGDRVKCPFSTPDDLLRLDVISDIAQHFDGWDNQSGVNEKVNINNDASRARLLSEVDNLDGRSSEATLSSLTSIDKEAVRWILKESALLRLPSTRARLAVKMFLPILGYDPMRLHKVIWSLALSLGMNQKELTRVITMIPRTLSLSVEGKLTQLLRVLSRFAVRYLVHNNGIYDDEIEPPNGRAGRKPSLDRELERESEEWKNDVNDMSDLNEGIIIDADGVFVDDINQSVIERNDIFAHLDAPTLDAIYRRRNHTVRSMIRDHVLRYPLLLSTSVEKVEARIGNIMSDPDLMKAFHWSDFVRALRRTEAQHRSWKKKVWSLALPFKSTVLGSTKPIYLKEPKSKLNFLSNSYDIETGILLDDSATQSVVRMANGFLMPTKYLKQPPVLPSNQDNSALSMWKSRLQSGKSPNEIDSEVTTATATVPDAFDSDISGDGKIKGPNKKLSISLRKKNSSK